MPPKPRPHGPRKPTTSRQPLSRNMLIALAAGGAAAVAVVVVLVVALGGGSNGGGGSARAALEAAGCTLRIVPTVPPPEPSPIGYHAVADPDGSSDLWNTDPPSSGPHNERTAVYGLFDSPVPQASVVHNLEHGAVAVQYGSDVPAATVEQLKSFYNEHQNGTIVAPLPRLGDEIALTAWIDENPAREFGEGVLAKCTQFDQAAFSAFFDEFQFRGPERFPPESMAPGAN